MPAGTPLSVNFTRLHTLASTTFCLLSGARVRGWERDHTARHQNGTFGPARCFRIHIIDVRYTTAKPFFSLVPFMDRLDDSTDSATLAAALPTSFSTPQSLPQRYLWRIGRPMGSPMPTRGVRAQRTTSWQMTLHHEMIYRAADDNMNQMRDEKKADAPHLSDVRGSPKCNANDNEMQETVGPITTVERERSGGNSRLALCKTLTLAGRRAS